MWIAGDAIMLAYIMLVVLMWSRDDRTVSATSGWLEAVRKSRFDDLVAAGSPAAGSPVPGGPAPGSAAAAGAARGGIDDDEHLAAYNAYLARLHHGGDAGPGPGGDR
jgi:hypothetical protein